MTTKETSPKRGRPKKIIKKELPVDMTNMSERSKMELGIGLFDQGSYPEAIEVFSRIIDEDTLLARQYLARCYYRMLQYESAYVHFSYLVEHGEGKTRDYGASMVAAIEMMWGNYGNAIKQLRLLPENPQNLINLALAFWKKYQTQKEEFSIRESMRLLRKINLDTVSPLVKHTVFHLMALIYQAQKDYNLADSFYKKAIEMDVPLLNLGMALNDYASLHIERANFDEAYKILYQVRDFALGKYDIVEGFNNKWLGILASIHFKHQEAAQYLQQAAKFIHDKDLFIQLAGALIILANSTKNKDFFTAAEYFSNALNYEKLSEEVTERDEKIVMFYYGGFFGTNGNTSGIG